MRTFQSIFIIALLLLAHINVLMAQNSPAPGERMVGDFHILKIQDAQITLKISLLSGNDAAVAQKLNVSHESQITPVNAFVVKTPQHLILVDTGIGKGSGEDAGHLQDLLKEAGFDASQVDLILLTHLHFDHIGGLTSVEGKRMFPHATIRLSKAESDFWLRDTGSVPAEQRERARQIQKQLNPYIQANALKTFAPGESLAEGVKAQEAYGHTIGHCIYSFTSKGQEFWCVGDLIHFREIQFKMPKVGVVFDTNGKQAIDSRIAYFNTAAQKHILLGGSHLPEFIYVEKSDNSFIASPVKVK